VSDAPTSHYLTPTQVASALAQAATISPDFADQMKAALLADGYSVEASQVAPPITDAQARVESWTRLSQEQATRAINELIEAGVPREQVLAAAKADGFDTTIPEDKRNADLREFDNTAFGEATNPAQYEIAWFGRQPEYNNDLAAALALHPLDKAGFAPALDRGLRAGLLAMQFPAMAGPALVEDGLDAMRAYGAMKDAQKQIWANSQTYDLHSATGNAADIQLDAKLMIERWHQANPKLVEALAKAGFFKSAKVQTALHLQAQRLYHRAELSASKT
jgi:hypothetical protein